MKAVFIISVSVALAGLTACDGADEEGLTEREAATQAEDLVGGEAQEAERVDHEGTPIWEVDVTMSNGARIEVKLHAEAGHLVGLEDKTGPFDYDLSPIEGALSFSAITEKASAEVQGTVEAWELEAEAEGDEIEYEWELYVRDADGQLWEMFLHAEDGQVLDIEAKDAIDP